MLAPLKRPPPGELLCILATVEPQHLAAWSAWLSEHERSRVTRLLREQDRALSTVAHGLKRLVLAKLLDCSPEQLMFGSSAYGKPMLTNGGASFNLSHSGNQVAMVAAAGGDVGVDIEWQRTMRYRDLAALVLHPDEAGLYAAQGYDDHFFLRLWTLKEALSKAIGLGLSLPFPSMLLAHAPGEAWVRTPQAGGEWYVRHWMGREGRHLAVAASFMPTEICFWKAVGAGELRALRSPF